MSTSLRKITATVTHLVPITKTYIFYAANAEDAKTLLQENNVPPESIVSEDILEEDISEIKSIDIKVHPTETEELKAEEEKISCEIEEENKQDTVSRF